VPIGAPPGAAPGGSRWRAAVRFAIAVVLSAAGALAWARALPRRLEITTDIVGYPTHAGFDPYPNFQRFYLAVVFFPVCAFLLHALIGRAWPRSDWPVRPTEPQERVAAWVPARQLASVLVTGTAFGIGVMLVGRGGRPFLAGVAVVAVAYAALLFGCAWLLQRRRGIEADRRRTVAVLDALAACFAPSVLLAASSATQVTVASDGAVHRFPWMGVAPVAVVVGILVAATLLRIRRAAGAAGRLLRIEEQGTLLLVVPVITFLAAARLPGPVDAFDTFHAGEFLAGAHLFLAGAFPWRDLIFIHGILQDVLIPVAGFRWFGETAWGGITGFSMFARPLFWVCHAWLYAYLFRRTPVLLAAAILIPILSIYSIPHDRLAPLPLVLLALAALLDRATLPRAATLAAVLVASNVLVPELGYVVPPCALVVVGYEAAHRDRAAPFLASFRRSWMTAASGCACVAAWFAFLAAHDAAGAFLHYYRTFARGHELTGSLPVAQQLLRDPSYAVPMLLPPIALILQTWYVGSRVRMRRRLEVRDWVMIALGLFVFMYYRKFLSRADMHVTHSAAPAVPLALYLLGLLIRPASGIIRNTTIVRSLGLVVLGVVVIVAPGGGWGNVSATRERLSLTVPRPASGTMGWWSAMTAPQSEADREIGRFLDAHLEPDDPIFDFTNQPARYHFALGRRPATRYYHVSMAIRRDTQLDLIAELERSRPKLVVFYSGDSALAGWDGISDPVRHYEVSHFLLAHYRPFARVRAERFYVRADLDLPVRRTSPSVEALRGAVAYRDAPICDWGRAPAFVPHPSLAPGPDLPIVADTDRGDDSVVTSFHVAATEPVAGLQIDADVARPGVVAVSVSTGPRPGGSDTSDPGSIRFATRPRSPEPIRVMLDNCPQWHGRGGDVVSLRHPPGIRIRGARALVRVDH
jgi:hypothetical protein